MNHKIILGIDPGTEKSAYVFMIGLKIIKAGYVENSLMLYRVQDSNYDICAVEGVRSFGKKVPKGNTTLITCEFAGILYQAARSMGKAASILYPNTSSAEGIRCIRAYLCGKVNSTKGEVKKVVKLALPGCWGEKRKQGPLYLEVDGKQKDHKIRAAAVVLTYQGSEQYQKECMK